MGVTIGVDVGGTKIAAGIIDTHGAIVARARRETPSHDSDATVAAIVAVIEELARDNEVDAVGLGVPGLVNADRSTVLFSPNLAWRDVPVRSRVEQATGIHTVVENDANAAAWAEYRFGAGQGAADIILFTLGTGVGGGVILGGQILRGAHGTAAELGHARLVVGGELCGCGQRGCVEAYASGQALEREARAAVDSPDGRRLLEMADHDPKRITGRMITRAARVGDPLATRLMTDFAEWLGETLASFTAIFDPDIFLLGGGIADAGDLLLSPATKILHERSTAAGFRPLPRVALASMGNDAGMVGAADLARL